MKKEQPTPPKTHPRPKAAAAVETNVPVKPLPMAQFAPQPEVADVGPRKARYAGTCGAHPCLYEVTQDGRKVVSECKGDPSLVGTAL
jgi:hypothetical protein